MIRVLAAAFLFNLGQGTLRPTMPLYLQQIFSANYRMVTSIPTVFGAGKWIASLPAGYLLGRVGRGPLMAAGLVLIACGDVASVMTSAFGVFLALRAIAGVGWATFGTVATASVLDGTERRGRSVSSLMMSEALGLFLGTAGGGWLYEGLGVGSPFLFEAACMIVAAVAVARWAAPGPARPAPPTASHDWRLVGAALRAPGVPLMGLTNAVLTAIQTGVLVFLFPLYLVERGGLGPETVGLLVSLGVLGRLLALWLGGNISDRWDRMRVLIAGLIVYAALLAGLAFTTHPVALGLGSLAIGAAAGFVAALPTALVGDLVSSPLRGVAIGWLRTMTDSGQILGPLVMGALADALTLATPFLCGTALLMGVAWQCHRRAGVIGASA